ncbi:phenylacetate--CoA ligase family protein [Candidatus Thiodictyon syntrophicum]|jgi:phenylacetate-CoA ligase|uniref:Phenylacetate-coenzyme A ligase n=1 Tax=Candidatus Thiodictyon syntrophicum TaxID=1166950 RepID=A0A2K8U6X8_9GAMM|nr:phenylacetate--CoA ligase [Candidatus Thiodictyon syntrophicum]AUB81297.1 phenylacetate--CoA ligase [Candidatus Thiodictyon syntrophicum]
MPTPGFAIENRVFDPAETLPRPELEALQLERLRALVERVATVHFYREHFRLHDITRRSIRSLDDIRRLPFTTKEDLRRHQPLGFLAVPRRDVARIHGSSGTTGRPTFVAYTAQDLKTWSGLCARFLVAGGLRPEHTVQIAFGYGLFTGGFGLHYGVERVGAAIIPAASGNTRRQLDIIHDLAPEVLVCTPSYALTIADGARDLGMDPRSLPLRFGHFGGEPWTEDMRREIEEQLDILAFNNYGLSEIIGPGVSGECAARNGMHLQEDHFLVECIDPETLEPVPEGEPGELVITTLTREAVPMIRYRTRDIARLYREPCPCGRNTTRMGRVAGRSDDMLIIRGVNVFPSQIEEALLRVEGTTPHYLIEVDRPGTLDQVTVKVEIRAEMFSDRMDRMQALRERIAREIHAVAGIRAEVDLVEPRRIERFAGKAKRVLDKRALSDS